LITLAAILRPIGAGAPAGTGPAGQHRLGKDAGDGSGTHRAVAGSPLCNAVSATSTVVRASLSARLTIPDKSMLRTVVG